MRYIYIYNINEENIVCIYVCINGVVLLNYLCVT